MTVELLHLHLLLVGENVQPDFQGCQCRENVSTHEICQGEGGIGGAGKEGTAFIQIRDTLTGKIVVAYQPAAVSVPLQCLAEQHGKQRPLVLGSANQLGKLAQQIHPGVNVGGTVVAVNHGNRCTGRSGDHVNLPVNPQGVVGDNHGKVGGTGGHIAGALPHGVGGDHARPGITLAGCNGNAGLQVASRIQESSAPFGQYTGIVSGA